MYITERSSNAVQLPELDVLIEHFVGFTRMLFNSDLESHFVQERIITMDDLNNLEAITATNKKSQFVLSKVHSALKVGFPAPFYKILKIMKNFGNGAVQEFSTKIDKKISEQNEGLLYLTELNYTMTYHVCTYLYMYMSFYNQTWL